MIEVAKRIGDLLGNHMTLGISVRTKSSHVFNSIMKYMPYVFTRECIVKVL